MSARNVKTPGAALARTNVPVKPMMPGREIRAADGLENVVAGMGTSRDKRSYTQWSMPRVMTRQELDNMYRGSWLAKRIINTPAEDMTREWVHITFDENADTQKENEQAIEETEKQFNVKDKITDAIKWARLYGGACVVIGTNDSKDLAQPLNIDSLGKDCLRYLHVLDRWRMIPSGVLETDLDSPNFGLPTYYHIAESAVVIHPSRILMFHGEKLPYFPWMNNGMWHDSTLQHVVESLMDSETVNRAISTMIFESNVDVINAPELAETLSTKEGEARLTKRFQVASLMKSFNRILLLDGEETYTKHSNSFANLNLVQQGFVIDVCGSADIPFMRLFGQSAAGFGEGDNDVRNYYDALSSKQESTMRSNMEYLYHILCIHTFGSVPDNFCLEFNTLWQVSDKEQAEIDYNNAQRDKIYLDAAVLTEGTVAKELKERGTYRTMTDDDVELAEELAKIPEPAPIVVAPGGAVPNQGNPQGGAPMPTPAPTVPAQGAKNAAE